MLSEEKQYFIRILADHINERKTQKLEGIDWGEISNLAEIHQVEGIVYYQCKEYLPLNIKTQFENAFLSTIFHYSRIKNAMNEVGEAFSENKIGFFVVKGIEIAKYYPVSSLRTMGDCDMVLQHKHMRKAIDIMKQLGFKSSMQYNVEQFVCHRDEIFFELHNALVQDGEFTIKKQEVFFNEYKPYLLNGSLDVSFHFLFLLMHIRKHFLNYNVGIRQIMDLAVVMKNVPYLKWTWLKEKLERLDLLRFAQAFLGLSEYLFEVKPAIECNALNTQEYEWLTDCILRGGVFGFADEDNMRNAEKTSLAKKKGPLWLRKKMVVLRNVFPKYSLMKTYPGCGFLYKRPFLLPIAWVYRLAALIMRNGNIIEAQIRREKICQKDILEREEVLRIVGLL